MSKPVVTPNPLVITDADREALKHLGLSDEEWVFIRAHKSVHQACLTQPIHCGCVFCEAKGQSNE